MPAPTNGHAAELGSSVPICTPHAVSVSLPTWKDNVDYELGLDRVHARLTTGYPRFFIHQDIQKARLSRSSLLPPLGQALTSPWCLHSSLRSVALPMPRQPRNAASSSRPRK
ncbi:hypothetical protein PTTG_08422, partial [Puccinia triticina 1-1 BBBD Race 1]